MSEQEHDNPSNLDYQEYKRNEPSAQVPTGQKVHFDSMGVPFIDDDNDSEEEKRMIANEHKRPSSSVHICSLHSTIEQSFGLSTRLYFDFVVILILLNIVLTVIQLPVFAVHWIKFMSFIKQQANLINALFFSSYYDPSLIWYWRSVNILSAIVIFVFPLVYYVITYCYFRHRERPDFENAIVDDDTIVENAEYTFTSRVVRLLVSYSVFFIVMLVQLAIVTGCTVLQSFAYIQDQVGKNSTWTFWLFSILISIIMTVSNLIWDFVVYYLIQFEKHRSWTTYRRHYAFKVMFFKLSNIGIMMFAKGLFTIACIPDAFGYQLFVQMLVDLVINNVLEIIVPYAKYLICSCCTRGNYEHIRPEFNVADEFLELVYRQYIIYIGMTSFPMITLVAVISTFTEMWVDRLRLIYICAKPKVREGSLKSTVTVFLFMAALLAVANPGGGLIYTLIGKYFCIPGSIAKDCTLCHVFSEQCKNGGCFIRIGN